MKRIRAKTKKAGHRTLFEPKPKIKVLIIITLVFALCTVVGGLFYALYFKSPYFTVKNVIFLGQKKNTSINYFELEDLLVDKNIFVLRLSDTRRNMLEKYAELRDLELTRAFPDSITAVISLREPIAQLYKNNYYKVDKDGVILFGMQDLPFEGLPIITGVKTDLSRYVGKRSDSARINKAIELLEEINSSGILDQHRIVEIDISNLRNAIIFLEDGLEIKIGQEDYSNRLASLKNILQDVKIRPEDIRYIDLRFKEPVIGPRWKK